MPVLNRNKGFLNIILIVLLLTPAFFLLPASLSEMAGVIGFQLMDKSDLKVVMSTVDPSIKELSADPSNKLVLNVIVRDSKGDSIKDARITAKVSEGLGTLASTSEKTASDGSLLLQYSPPYLGGAAFKYGNPVVKLTAGISGTDMKSELYFKLVRIPVVFVHGYQAFPELFSNMKEYLEGKGFVTEGLSYASGKGVASGAAELGAFIDKVKAGFLEKGTQVGKLDIIAHSMGGLVARYYTTDGSYPLRSDVDKIIFISVPQTGSPIASLGLQYYNDQGIHDLIPDSTLFTDLFPTLINAGLNASIQVGSILDQYDEVVSPESASLERWGIKTEMFDVGDSNFTVDKLLSGKIVEAANHKAVLFNKKVFQRVEEMLGSQLPYPTRK